MLIGSQDTRHLKTLVSNYLNRNAEELAAYSVYPQLNKIDNNSISHFYKLLQSSNNKIQNEILRHPLFKICLDSFSDYCTNASSYKRTLALSGLNILEGIYFDYGIHHTSKLKTDINGKIYLPCTKIIIELPAKYHSIPVSIEKTKSGVIINDIYVSINDSDYFRTFESNGFPFRILNLRNTSLNLDTSTSPFLQNGPNDWRVAPLTSQSINEWNDVIAKASELITSSSENQIAWSEVNYFIKYLIPVKSYFHQRHISSSSITSPGIVCLSFTEDEVQIAQALIHEAGHNKLFMYEFLDDLILTNKNANLKSPWRRDLRPPRGLLHGAFSFGGVALAWENLLKNGDLTGKQKTKIQEECITLKRQVFEALKTLITNCELSKTGKEIYEDIYSKIDSVDSKISSNGTTRILNSDSSFDEVDRFSLNVITEFEGLEKIYWELIKDFEDKVDFENLPDWIARDSRNLIDKHFEYSIPIYEFLKNDKRIRRIIYTHVLLGLMWRFKDYDLDKEIEAENNIIETEKISFYYLSKITTSLKELGVDLKYKEFSECFDFMNYSFENEKKGKLKYEEIWKRGTPYILIPSLFINDKEFIEKYKQYINLGGIIDDILDYEQDKINGINTWVNTLCNDEKDLKKNDVLLNTISNLQNILLDYTKIKFPVWNKFISNNSRTLSEIEIQIAPILK